MVWSKWCLSGSKRNERAREGVVILLNVWYCIMVEFGSVSSRILRVKLKPKMVKEYSYSVYPN